MLFFNKLLIHKLKVEFFFKNININYNNGQGVLIKKTIKFLILSLVVISFFSCSKKNFLYQKDKNIQNFLKEKPNYPDIKFVVASDFHYFSPDLGMEGKEFEKYINRDRKMIRESKFILDKFSEIAISLDFDFLIIPGDLTKDGEYKSHREVANYLKKIEKNGKDVYVICGNHDVNNYNAKGYKNSKTYRVKQTGYKQFKKIYSDFGYKESIYSDKHSLSYVVEINRDLWLIALDSCLWQFQSKLNKKSFTNGRINPPTLHWLENILIKSAKKNKKVILFMHHGLLEHFKKNSKYLKEYLVDDYKSLGKMLSFYNVKTVFTGHFHSQDITMEKYKNTIYDIETGSLVTYPSPYRIITINNSIMSIKSKKINSIDGIKDFQIYAKNHTKRSNKLLFQNILNEYPVKKKDVQILSDYLAESLLQHFSGDEKRINFNNYKDLSIFGKFAFFLKKDLPYSWQKDLIPEDNSLKINLITGEVIK
ncbi:MAG: metallophosphoesterase [Candidatus Mcinerneyibacterium aminivorans]|uniref:Metallophosphoesterase n=1 Tax=Candidatus Mcinerneyibacterium aminivorans TaxID=2703815 RepID=A0A5D0ME79_9BACT|nr:MAG: metallophosphoesterase [Candidatus Mcinerneyibacterium aminivorans]